MGWSGSSWRDGAAFVGSARFLSWAAVLVTLLAWLALVAGNLSTLYRVDHAGGTWTALAYHAIDGTLYPPLFEGGPHGSRYMPVPVTAHALAASATGELLVSGRLVDLVFFGATSAMVVVALRRLAVPAPLVGLVLVAPLLTEPGLENVLGLRHDIVGVALQLGALLCLASGRAAAWAAAAGMLLGLAVLASLTALWAGAAIVVWLVLRREGHRLGAVMLAGLIVLGAGAVVVNVASEGRFLMSLLTPGLAGERPPGIGGPVPGLPRLVEQALTRAPHIALLLPVLVALAPAIRWRGTEGLYALAAAMATIELVVVFGDRGVFGNHLLSVVILVPLATAIGVARSGPAMTRTASAGLVIATAFAFQLNVGGDLVATLTGEPRPDTAHPPLATHITPGTTVLSEDPGVETFNRRAPTVVDPYMLRRVAQRDPASVQPLVERIQDREFDLVVTVLPLAGDPRWYSEYHFGEAVWSALLEGYAFEGRVEGYYLYRPVDASAAMLGPDVR